MNPATPIETVAQESSSERLIHALGYFYINASIAFTGNSHTKPDVFFSESFLAQLLTASPKTAVTELIGLLQDFIKLVEKTRGMDEQPLYSLIDKSPKVAAEFQKLIDQLSPLAFDEVHEPLRMELQKAIKQTLDA